MSELRYLSDDLREKIELIAAILGPTRYPLVRQVNGQDYIIGESVDNPIAPGKFLFSGTGFDTVHYPVLCKLTDIWAD